VGRHARAGSYLRASPTRGLHLSELKNHDHQDDDHEDTDDGSNNSPVHGQYLLSGLRPTPRGVEVNTSGAQRPAQSD
jgi:hypothetical protein